MADSVPYDDERETREEKERWSSLMDFTKHRRALTGDVPLSETRIEKVVHAFVEEDRDSVFEVDKSGNSILMAAVPNFYEGGDRGNMDVVWQIARELTKTEFDELLEMKNDNGDTFASLVMTRDDFYNYNPDKVIRLLVNLKKLNKPSVDKPIKAGPKSGGKRQKKSNKKISKQKTLKKKGSKRKTLKKKVSKRKKSKGKGSK